MHYTEEEIENIPGLLSLIDFKKAFNTVSWDFTLKTLSLTLVPLFKTGFYYFVKYKIKVVISLKESIFREGAGKVTLCHHILS